MQPYSECHWVYSAYIYLLKQQHVINYHQRWMYVNAHWTKSVPMTFGPPWSSLFLFFSTTRCCSHSLTNNPCRTRDSNPQPLDYKSDSLTIRPRLPPGHNSLTSSILNLFLNKLFKIIWFSCISIELLCFFLNWCNTFLSFIICCLCCYCCHIVCDFNLKT